LPKSSGASLPKKVTPIIASARGNQWINGSGRCLSKRALLGNPSKRRAAFSGIGLGDLHIETNISRMLNALSTGWIAVVNARTI
jgi:hypothetical protein